MTAELNLVTIAPRKAMRPFQHGRRLPAPEKLNVNKSPAFNCSTADQRAHCVALLFTYNPISNAVGYVISSSVCACAARYSANCTPADFFSEVAASFNFFKAAAMSLCSDSIVGISASSLSVIFSTLVILHSNLPCDSGTKRPSGGRAYAFSLAKCGVQNLCHEFSSLAGPPA